MKAKRTAASAFDEISSAVRGCNEAACELSRLSEESRRALESLEDALLNLLQFPALITETGTEKASKLLRRVDRLRELRNMQELGSFQLEVTREMEDIWKGLP